MQTYLPESLSLSPFHSLWVSLGKCCALILLFSAGHVNTPFEVHPCGGRLSQGPFVVLSGGTVKADLQMGPRGKHCVWRRDSVQGFDGLVTLSVVLGSAEPATPPPPNENLRLNKIPGGTLQGPLKTNQGSGPAPEVLMV